MQKTLIVVLVLVAVLAVALYLVTKKQSVEQPVGGWSTEAPMEEPTPSEAEAVDPMTFTWTLEDKGEDPETLSPLTRVTLSVGGTVHDVGTYAGSCSEIEESAWELLPGERSGVICWWAGGGQEIGVFEEEGKLVVKVGVLEEGTAETSGTRGNFETLLEL